LPGWLAVIRDGFGTTIGAIGGRVHPIWKAPAPWLADAIAGALTIIDWGPSRKFIDDIRREWLVGANMAVPKALLAEVGGFHPWLNRVGNTRAGMTGRPVPVFPLRECVPTTYLSLDTVCQRFIDHCGKRVLGWVLRRVCPARTVGKQVRSI
jgi:hypothetical protein